MGKSAGSKDRRIILRAPVKSKATTGGPVVTYPADTFTVWAEKINAGGSERFRDQRDISIQDLVFMAYYLGLEAVDTEWQLSYNSEDYDIISAVEVGNGEDLQILARLAK